MTAADPDEAAALSIPLHVFGLAPSPAPGPQRHGHLSAVTTGPSGGASSTVTGRPGPKDGEEG